MDAGHLAFFALLLVAEVLGTVGGFGSSMLVMPLAVRFLPFEQALGLTALFHVFSNAAKMVLFRKGVSRNLLLWLGIPAVLGVVLGARLTIFFDPLILSKVMGAMLIIMGAGLLLRPAWKIQASNANALAGGTISGLVAGLTGTGGAIRGITLAAFDLEKIAFISTSAWIDMGVDLSRTVVYAAQGFLSPTVLSYLPAMALASWVGSWVGKRAVQHIPQHAFRVVVLSIIIGMGLITMLSGG
ncbi:MAG: sulfite exporter TauE/SafE family protein [Flavobacteriales bacterium]|nr:sulfite exporter TauE/SafE family protein [Flavobacteriales bacterium]